jgi:hydrogen peroxide-dependent heme synthase
MTNDTATYDESQAQDRHGSYAVWAVYARVGEPLDDAAAALADHAAWLADTEVGDIVVRGRYDVSGMRAEADLMVWLHGPTAEGLQSALRSFRRTMVGRATSLVWSAMGTHRPAEFSPDHVPAFMRGKDPLRWLCVYPFVRSYEWYLLPEPERGAMLREHGLAGRAFPHVLTNTVAAFGLNDYEWILPLESDDLHELVDLMRDLRATQARRHVRVEVPFYTGHLVDDAGVIEILR